ncbi:MAG: hypothetical protein QOE47_1799 [Pyrinomonadaceae bacterium]|nr:hypothetical protein [Pyrinomonadaceae bacterium]
MHTVCQNCGASLDTPYIMLGAAAECHSCGARTIPKVPTGTSFPLTGYEITFAAFQQLLFDPAYRPSVAPLLRRWFGYELEVSGDAVLIRSRDGDEVAPLSLHQNIQEDSSKQYTLYQAAMNLWR